MPAGKKSTPTTTENGSTTAPTKGTSKTKAAAAAAAAAATEANEKRTVFRPPWVKDDANPSSNNTGKKSTATSWSKEGATAAAKKRDSLVLDGGGSDSDTPVPNFPMPQLRKVSLPKAPEPPQENGKENTFIRPPLKPVKTKEPPTVPLTKEDSKIKIPKLNSVKAEKMRELPPPPKKDNPDYRQVLHKTPTVSEMDKGVSKSKSTHGPPPPPMPPPPPKMPRPIDVPVLTEEQKQKIDALKSRPKARPDWSQLLKGIESGKKLKHVECNDRSKPLLPAAKAKGQFLYESEKDNAHNVLLKEIQSGVKLKEVKTNDRSRPMLEGLRKFRRQMTIEEQIQKSVSMASMPPEEIALTMPEEADEMDDIDRVRDDLQSTKQLLAMELRNKEALARENKRFQSRIQNLEKEMEIEKEQVRSESKVAYKGEENEKLMTTLKAEAAQARKKNEELEKKFTQAATSLDKTKAELEECKKRNEELEKEIQEILAGKKISISLGDRRESRLDNPDDDDGGFGAENEESSSDDEDNEEKKQKRIVRELKLLSNKLRNIKNKEDNAKKERIALKEIMRKHQAAIKAENKKFRSLQKEVNKIGAMMKDTGEDDEDADDEDDDGEETEVAEDTETESSETDSSETEESESERSQSEPEDAPPERKKENLIGRTRRHENRLNALKKTNFMLKTSAETLQDNHNLQKEKTQQLQQDLDSVLAELG